MEVIYPTISITAKQKSFIETLLITFSIISRIMFVGQSVLIIGCYYVYYVYTGLTTEKLSRVVILATHKTRPLISKTIFKTFNVHKYFL